MDSCKYREGSRSLAMSTDGSTSDRKVRPVSASLLRSTKARTASTAVLHIPVEFPSANEQLLHSQGPPQPQPRNKWQGRVEKVLQLQRRGPSEPPVHQPGHHSSSSAPALPWADQQQQLQQRQRPRSTACEPQRELPSALAHDLLSDAMRTELIEYARHSPAELVLLVDLQPAEAPTREPFLCMHRGGGARLAGRVGSLQHSEDQYEYHLERLRRVVDGAIRSRQFPQACYIEAAVERLPHYWATEWGGTQTKSGPALRDWKLRSSVTAAEAASARLASNVHRLGVCASRLGAFEIYLVWQPRQQTVPTTPTAAARASVEQCFSKLFSRCWPRAEAVLERVRAHAGVAEGMRLQEARHVLRERRRATGDGTAILSLRATLDEYRASADWPALQRSDEVRVLTAWLAELEVCEALETALIAAKAAGGGEESLGALEAVAAMYLERAPPEVAQRVRAELHDRCDEVLRMLLAQGDRATYERMRPRLKICSDEVARRVGAKLDEVERAEVQLRSAMQADEATTLATALEGLEPGWSPELHAQARTAFQIRMRADTALQAAISTRRKPELDAAIASHGPTGSRSVVECARCALLDCSDAALGAVLVAGDRETLERVGIRDGHLSSCRPPIADAVARRRLELETSALALERALTGGEAAEIIATLKAIDQRSIPREVAVAHDALRALLPADAALKQAIGAAAAVIGRVERADAEADKARPLLEAAQAAEDAAITQLQLAEAEAAAAEGMHTLGDQLDEACNEARGQLHDLEREMQAAKAQQEGLKGILEQNKLTLEEALTQDSVASFDLMTRSNSVTAAQKQKALDILSVETAQLAATKAQLAAASERVASLVGALQKQSLKAEELADELRRELERDTTEMRLRRARMLQAREARTQAEDDRRVAERTATLAASHVKEAIRELFSATSALGELLAKCSPSVAREAEAKRQLLANTALKSSLHAGDGAALAAAAQTYLPYCSREVALMVQQALDATLLKLLRTADGAALSAAAPMSVHCSPDVAQAVQERLAAVGEMEEGLQSALGSGDVNAIIAALQQHGEAIQWCPRRVGECEAKVLEHALASREALRIGSWLQRIERRLSPAAVASAHDALRTILTADAALKRSIGSGELFTSALGELLAKCSPSVAREAEAKRQLLANTALKSSLHAGDGAALAAAAQTYLPYCSREVALLVQQTLGAVDAVEKMLQAALMSDHVPRLEQALQYADPKWNPSGVAACKARLEARLWEARREDGAVRLQSDLSE